MFKEGYNIEKNYYNKIILNNIKKLLKLFLLRRIKKNLLINLVNKKEVIFYIKLNKKQKNFYKKILFNLDSNVIDYIIKQEELGSYATTATTTSTTSPTSTAPATSNVSNSSLSSSAPTPADSITPSETSSTSESAPASITDADYRKLMNVLLQLRKVCNSVHLLEGVPHYDTYNYLNSSSPAFSEDFSSSPPLSPSATSSETSAFSENNPSTIPPHSVQREIVLNNLLEGSNKLIFLSKLLKMLKLKGHRVLIFSQFTSMLNILEDFLTLKNYKYLRLDGETNRIIRKLNIKKFNIKNRKKNYYYPDEEDSDDEERVEDAMDTSENYQSSKLGKKRQEDLEYKRKERQEEEELCKKLNLTRGYTDLTKENSSYIYEGKEDQEEEEEEEENDDYFIFLISTRAGGLGLNLTSADTVILFDSDWNPQVDLQAMERVHRIGQEKPVRIYRLLCYESIEERIINRANKKILLNDMIIEKKYKKKSKPEGEGDEKPEGEGEDYDEENDDELENDEETDDDDIVEENEDETLESAQIPIENSKSSNSSTMNKNELASLIRYGVKAIVNSSSGTSDQDPNDISDEDLAKILELHGRDATVTNNVDILKYKTFYEDKNLRSDQKEENVKTEEKSSISLMKEFFTTNTSTSSPTSSSSSSFNFLDIPLEPSLLENKKKKQDDIELKNIITEKRKRKDRITLVSGSGTGYGSFVPVLTKELELEERLNKQEVDYNNEKNEEKKSSRGWIHQPFCVLCSKGFKKSEEVQALKQQHEEQIKNLIEENKRNKKLEENKIEEEKNKLKKSKKSKKSQDYLNYLVEKSQENDKKRQENVKLLRTYYQELEQTLAIEQDAMMKCTFCPLNFHTSCASQAHLIKKKVANTPSLFLCPHHTCSDCHRSTASSGGLLFRCQGCLTSYCDDCLPADEVEDLERCHRYEKKNHYFSRQSYFILCKECCLQEGIQPMGILGDQKEKWKKYNKEKEEKLKIDKEKEVSPKETLEADEDAMALEEETEEKLEGEGEDLEEDEGEGEELEGEELEGEGEELEGDGDDILPTQLLRIHWKKFVPPSLPSLQSISPFPSAPPSPSSSPIPIKRKQEESEEEKIKRQVVEAEEKEEREEKFLSPHPKIQECSALDIYSLFLEHPSMKKLFKTYEYFYTEQNNQINNVTSSTASQLTAPPLHSVPILPSSSSILEKISLDYEKIKDKIIGEKYRSVNNLIREISFIFESNFYIYFTNKKYNFYKLKNNKQKIFYNFLIQNLEEYKKIIEKNSKLN